MAVGNRRIIAGFKRGTTSGGFPHNGDLLKTEFEQLAELVTVHPVLAVPCQQRQPEWIGERSVQTPQLVAQRLDVLAFRQLVLMQPRHHFARRELFIQDRWIGVACQPAIRQPKRFLAAVDASQEHDIEISAS